MSELDDTYSTLVKEVERIYLTAKDRADAGGGYLLSELEKLAADGELRASRLLATAYTGGSESARLSRSEDLTLKYSAVGQQAPRDPILCYLAGIVQASRGQVRDAATNLLHGSQAGFGFADVEYMKLILDGHQGVSFHYTVNEAISSLERYAENSEPLDVVGALAAQYLASYHIRMNTDGIGYKLALPHLEKYETLYIFSGMGGAKILNGCREYFKHSSGMTTTAVPVADDGASTKQAPSALANAEKFSRDVVTTILPDGKTEVRFRGGNPDSGKNFFVLLILFLLPASCAVGTRRDGETAGWLIFFVGLFLLVMTFKIKWATIYVSKEGLWLKNGKHIASSDITSSGYNGSEIYVVCAGTKRHVGWATNHHAAEEVQRLILQTLGNIRS